MQQGFDDHTAMPADADGDWRFEHFDAVIAVCIGRAGYDEF